MYTSLLVSCYISWCSCARRFGCFHILTRLSSFISSSRDSSHWSVSHPHRCGRSVTFSNPNSGTHLTFPYTVSRIDSNMSLAHIAWSSLIQIMISLIILLINLGPSALAGFSLFLMGIPVQSWIMKRSYVARTDSMEYTDQRVKLTQDLLNGIRVIKFFAWERPFLKSLIEIRKNEMRLVTSILQPSLSDLFMFLLGM